MLRQRNNYCFFTELPASSSGSSVAPHVSRSFPKHILRSVIAILDQRGKFLMKTEFSRKISFLRIRFCDAEAGVRYGKDPEPFNIMMWEYRSMCGIPEPHLNYFPAAAKMMGAEQNRGSITLKYDRLCLPCFKQFAIID